MSIKYQLNKVEIQNFRRQLKTRESALPTLKNKESVLRAAVARQKEILAGLNADYERHRDQIEEGMRLWGEFPPDIFYIKEIRTRTVKVAGVSVPELDEIVWDTREYSQFNRPAWLTQGIRLLKQLATDLSRLDLARKDMEILEKARRRTSQKVNLYEKVQIPEFSQAILKIKRYLEDIENLEKAAEKIVKQRIAVAEFAEGGGGDD